MKFHPYYDGIGNRVRFDAIGNPIRFDGMGRRVNYYSLLGLFVCWAN